MGEAEGLYALLKQIVVSACAAAAVVAGFRIYMKWNRGEFVSHLIFSWLVGILSVGALTYAVTTYIYGGGLRGGLAIGWTDLLKTELYEAVMLFGIVVSIVSIIRIYFKYNEGEDIVPLIYQWVGSLLFLSVMGWIIQSVIKY